MPQGQVFEDGSHRAFGFLGSAGFGFADHTFRGGGDFDGKMALRLPTSGWGARTDRQIYRSDLPAGRFALGIHGVVHVHHLGVEQQAERGLGFIGMHEVGVHLPAALHRAEEFAHAAVPVDHPEDAGELIALLEFLHSGFEHPQLPVVVDNQLLAETIIPQARA